MATIISFIVFVFYIVPLLIVAYTVYQSEDVKSIKDIFKGVWNIAILVPFVNIIFALASISVYREIKQLKKS